MTRRQSGFDRLTRTLSISPIMILAAAAVLMASSSGTVSGPIIPAGPFTPGQSYFGRNNYIEYIAGDGPIILSAAHGGSLRPSGIPDRNDTTCGADANTTGDANTRELVLAMQQAIHARFGSFPHVVINHLHRIKLDANRPISDAACGSSDAGVAWLEYHTFLDIAKLAVLKQSGKGWYMDMHGHAHAIQRLEIGYDLSATDLRRSDSALDTGTAAEDASSISTVSKDETNETFSKLLRGPNSLGALYAANFFPAVPSLNDPFPQTGQLYFNGGFSTERHTCGTAAGPLGGLSGGNICGVQIETNMTGVRDTRENRERFAAVTAAILEAYLSTHWGIQLGGH
jgi:hypothetical protein